MIQFLCLVAGLTLLSYAVFSYKTEEENVANWFNDAFETLRRRDATISEKLRLALRSLVIGTARFLDRVYGPQLLSWRSLLASLSLCLAFAALFMIEVASWHPVWGRQYARETPLLVLFAIVALVAPFVPAPFRLRLLLLLPVIATAGLAIDTLKSTLLLLGVAVAALFDALGAAAMRFLLRASAMAPRLRASVLCLSVAITAPFFAVVGFAEFIRTVGGRDRETMNELINSYVASAIVLLLPLLITMFFAIVLLAAINMRILYAAAPRATYSVIKFKMLENRKPLVTIGLLLTAVGSPAVGEVLQSILKPLYG